MNNKRKNSMLILVGFLAVFICYKLAIQRTLEQKTQYRELKSQEELFSNIPRQFGLLNEKNKHYDSLLKKFQITETSMQNNLLKTINKASEKLQLKLIDFDEPHIFSENGRSKNSFLFKVEGSFENILKLVHQLEQKTRYGEVTNLHFHKLKNPKNRKPFLQAEVLIMNYK